MSTRWSPALLIVVVASGLAPAEDVKSQTGTTLAAKEAFAEAAVLKEQAFTQAFYNAKQQRLREHGLEVPIGPLPPARAAEAAPLPPAQTKPPKVQKGEAGFGVNIVQNRPLSKSETSSATSTVGEPSLAVRGREILFAGNWFASFSKDGGQSFQYRNPATMFPAIPSRAFCCDQVALYVPSHDLMVWFLQYSMSSTGNTVRLAVAQGADIAAERWRFYDFTPQGVGNWAGEWFDYPDLGVTDGNLFVSTNCFNQARQFKRSVVLRLPLAQLKTYAALGYQHFNRTDVGSLRLTQGKGNTMHIGSHLNLGALRVFAWKDGVGTFQTKDFTVQPWVRGGAASPGPDGRDWLGFVDGRITAAWNSGTTQGFGWTSAQGGGFAKPNVRMAVINWAAGTVVSQPHIWNASTAFAYPAAAVNATNRVGVTLFHNSSSRAPSHAVGVRNTNGTWALAGTVNGTHGPVSNRWGDYLSIRANGLNGNRFACSGFTLSGGPNQTNIVPRLVQFDVTGTPNALPMVPMVPTGPGVPEVMPMPPGGVAEVPLASPPATPSFTDNVVADIAKEKNRKFSAAAVSRPLIADLGRGNVETPKAVVPIGDGKELAGYAKLANLPPAYTFFYSPPESVCLPDDRRQVTGTTAGPWSGNCQLVITFQNGSQAIGTGWFAGPRTVVTAGHCVHEGEGGGFFKSVEVIPAMSGTRRPFGSMVATDLRASEGWKAVGSQAADYGAILLPKEFKAVNGKTPFVYPVAVAADAALTGKKLTISGYPADKPFGTQWRDAGTVQSVLPARLAYTIDTFGGHSGSAVTGVLNRKTTAVGIHNYGGCPNKCTRITAAVKADLDRWVAEVGVKK